MESDCSHKNNGVQAYCDDNTVQSGKPAELRATPVDDITKNADLCVEENEHTAAMKRHSASMIEVKERAHNFLKDELLKAQQELALKDAQCHKLQTLQVKMGEELEDLTASLFQEANKMVQDANIKRMQAEKLLKESKATIDVLQAEVEALKTLVITSTPSMPNRHLHPQLEQRRTSAASMDITTASDVDKTAFIKGHRRSTSHHNFSKDVIVKPDFAASVNSFHTTPAPLVGEVDPVYFEEFHTWQAQPVLTQTCTFLSHIITEDILPCLSFNNRQLSRSVFDGVMNNRLTIELVSKKLIQQSSNNTSETDENFNGKCALTAMKTVCHYRIKVQDVQPWYFISELARNRITAVCDFITYIRYITQGLVKSDNEQMYWEIIRLRKQMAIARLGLT